MSKFMKWETGHVHIWGDLLTPSDDLPHRKCSFGCGAVMVSAAIWDAATSSNKADDSDKEGQR